jgi:hypothetical protein
MGNSPQVQLDQSTFMPLDTASQPRQRSASSSPASAPGPDYSHVQLDSSTFSPIGGGHSIGQASDNQQPGIGERIWNAGKEELGSLAGGVAATGKAVVMPPEDATEHAIASVGGPGGLIAYRASKAVVDAADNIFKAKKENFRQAAVDMLHAINEFHSKDYRNALADTGSVVADIGGVTGEPMSTMGRAREIIQGTKPGGDIATPLTKDVVDVGAAAALERVGGKMAKEAEVPKNITDRLRSYRAAEGGEAAPNAKELNPVETTTAKNVAKAKLPAGENLAEEAQAHLEESTAGEINRIADSNRVSRPNPGPAHEMQRDVADSIYNRSKAEYAEVDARTGGKFQPNADKLANVNKKLRDIAGTDEEKEAEWEATKTKLLWQQDRIFEEAEKNGLGRDVVEKARKDFHTAQAQYDLSNNLRASALSDNPNALDAAKLRNRMNKMNITEEGGKPGRLTQAVGKESAINLEKNAHAAQFMSQLPPTETRALTEMVGNHTKTSLLRGATTDWKGVMDDFDALKPAEQKARFANPEAVRSFIRNQGRLVWAKRAAVGAAATVVGGGIWHEGSKFAP